jgi:serine protease Do
MARMPTMTKQTLIALTLLACAGFASAHAYAQAEQPSPADKAEPQAVAKVAAAVAPSLVRVQYTLRYDKGEEPRSLSGLVFRASPRGIGTGPYRSAQWDQFIADEQPFETFGIMIAPATASGVPRVLAPDLMLDARFIERIRIADATGSNAVDAAITAHASAQDAVVLQPIAAVPGTSPLVFNVASPEPHYTVRFNDSRGEWSSDVTSMARPLARSARGELFTSLQAEALFVDGAGVGVGSRFETRLPFDDSWKGDPTSWAWMPAKDLQARLDQTKAWADASVLRARIDFRSPKVDPNAAFARGDGDAMTEWTGVAVTIDPSTVLLLADLNAKTTARLERIRIFDAKNEPVTATFKGTLKDFSAIVATLERPISGSTSLAAVPPNTLRGTLLTAAEVDVQGENRTAYQGHTRILGFYTGPQGRVYPDVTSEADVVLFDATGGIVALPVKRREKVSVRSDYGEYPICTPSAYILEALATPAAGFDVGIAPLTEADENRLAWIGVELQPLDKELARLNKVADQTRDGSTGAIVTFVYSGSPAAKHDIQTGDVLLRLHALGQPKPIEISLDAQSYAFMENFPWDRLDEIPAEVYDRVPSPWGSAENSFTRALTDLGAGTPYEAEVAREGVIRRVPMGVEFGPSHYGSVKRFKDEASGITARDLTYETRRYFQFAPDDPGVIVSKVEAGSKAAVAGLRIFETITHVNDTPVNDVSEFEKVLKAAATGEGPTYEIRLNVKRMTQGRIVKFDVPKSEAK